MSQVKPLTVSKLYKRLEELIDEGKGDYIVVENYRETPSRWLCEGGIYKVDWMDVGEYDQEEFLEKEDIKYYLKNSGHKCAKVSDAIKIY